MWTHSVVCSSSESEAQPLSVAQWRWASSWRKRAWSQTWSLKLWHGTVNLRSDDCWASVTGMSCVKPAVENSIHCQTQSLRTSQERPCQWAVARRPGGRGQSEQIEVGCRALESSPRPGLADSASLVQSSHPNDHQWCDSLCHHHRSRASL
jgi:hypothetical protein